MYLVVRGSCKGVDQIFRTIQEAVDFAANQAKVARYGEVVSIKDEGNLPDSIIAVVTDDTWGTVLHRLSTWPAG